MSELPMVSISPIREDWVRRRVRVYQMVTELHKIGYQGLRIWPQIHHGRIIFVPSIFVTHSGAHGIVSPMFTSVGSVSMMDTYSTMNLMATYYGDEMARNNAREAANTFIREFPRIAELSLLDDYEYAGWLQRLTGEMEQGLHVWLPERFQHFDYDESGNASLNPDAHLVLMKAGADPRDNESVAKTFPMPPSPKIGGDDLSRLIGLLLSYLTP
jgi:hypothetical protein